MKISITEYGSVSTNYGPLHETQKLQNACILNWKMLNQKHAAAIDEKQWKPKKHDQKLTVLIWFKE